MIMFIFTLLLVLILLAIVLVTIFIGGSAFLLIFGDLILFVLIIMGIIKLFKKKK